ncbi:hypothetical protein NAT51_16110 [Flavobacterium amniphilum]|uniref:hypothetical protein n=1 Tax=Flavobacterium amniphilum TaxID=1834035 RepID=UPI002029DC11|nr:hypothetical protein [Flavobacterium amniphilum]MCL9807060.1 hypothetical protein [Flavobacterium amniphilum]
MTKTSKKELVIKVLKITSCIPLLPYPIVLLANLMSLMGHRSGDESDALIINTYAFLIVSTLYPATMIYSLVCNKKQRIIIAILPLVHLVASIYLGIKWMNTMS